MIRPLALSLLLLLCSSPSCAPSPPDPGARGGVPVVAGSPDGRFAAVGHRGLSLVDSLTEQRIPVADEMPLALAWRRDGQRLAAVFPGEGEGTERLVVFDREGQRHSETALPGRTVAVAWSARHDLLVAGYQLQQYSFGANLSQWLLRIDAAGAPPIKLGDVTIEPATAKQFSAVLPRLLQAAFSPQGDELVFLRLHDPPQSSPYLQLVYRNWQAEGERKLLDLPVRSAALQWQVAGEAITCTVDGEPPRTVELWPVPRPDAAVPIAGRPPSHLDDARLWTLRKWRFEGLITPEEFRTVAAEVKP